MMKKLFYAMLILISAVQVFAQSSLELGIEASQAISNDNWGLAESKLIQAIQAYDSERHESLYGAQPMYGIKIDLYAPINHVTACVDLALVQCNLNFKRGAIQAMEKAIYLIRNSSTLSGNNSHELAEQFLRKLRNGSVNLSFTAEEEARLSMMITAAPRANAERCHNQYMNRLEAIGRYCSSRSEYYQREMDRTARQAIHTADFDYRQNTGRDFDPNRPPSGTKARIEWDYCKKIHQIFD